MTVPRPTAGTWPPLPPQPPDPPFPRRTPWLPEPRPTAAPPASASATLVVGASDWLAERLLEQRMVALAGELDAETVNRTVAELALLDATGDEPVRLRLSGVSADVGAALTVVDALDLMGAPVHATCVGTLTGPAVALLAVADHRTAGPHALLHLTQPRSPGGIPGRDVESLAAEHARQLGRLYERLSAACGRPVDEIEPDMRGGRLLTTAEARDYGLVDVAEPTRHPSTPPSSAAPSR
ncbi:MAG: ATP-dependent Clp protease proteolytic subunit [Geodermatophilales bacterium]|nr:ATP-dependent Clp protease proteolytic subunit [Geodermatophilales bacterium]